MPLGISSPLQNNIYPAAIRISSRLSLITLMWLLQNYLSHQIIRKGFQVYPAGRAPVPGPKCFKRKGTREAGWNRGGDVFRTSRPSSEDEAMNEGNCRRH